MGGAVSSGENNDELVDNLLEADYIKSPLVERVFRAVDRAFYFTKQYKLSAYKDLAWKDGNFHLSAPCIYSEVMESLQLEPGLSFLNIGSGTGYLSTMAGLILGAKGINHGIELHPEVVEYADQKLANFLRVSSAIDLFSFCKPNFINGNCMEIAPCLNRYDRIYCGAACPDHFLQVVIDMLKINGICIVPLNDSLVSVTKISEARIETKNLLPVSFASLVAPKVTGKDHPIKAKDPINLPEINPLTLSELCREEIRSIIRKNINSPDLIKGNYGEEGRKRRRRKRAERRRASRLLVVQRRRDGREGEGTENGYVAITYSMRATNPNSTTEDESGENAPRNRRRRREMDTEDADETRRTREPPSTSEHMDDESLDDSGDEEDHHHRGGRSVRIGLYSSSRERNGNCRGSGDRSNRRNSENDRFRSRRSTSSPQNRDNEETSSLRSPNFVDKIKKIMTKIGSGGSGSTGNSDRNQNQPSASSSSSSSKQNNHSASNNTNSDDKNSNKSKEKTESTGKIFDPFSFAKKIEEAFDQKLKAEKLKKENVLEEDEDMVLAEETDEEKYAKNETAGNRDVVMGTPESERKLKSKGQSEENSEEKLKDADGPIWSDTDSENEKNENGPIIIDPEKHKLTPFPSSSDSSDSSLQSMNEYDDLHETFEFCPVRNHLTREIRRRRRSREEREERDGGDERNNSSPSDDEEDDDDNNEDNPEMETTREVSRDMAAVEAELLRFEEHKRKLNEKIEAQETVYITHPFSILLRDKVNELPLPPVLKSYLNYNRNFSKD